MPARRWLVIGLVLFLVSVLGLAVLFLKPDIFSSLTGSASYGVLTLEAPQSVHVQIPFTLTVKLDTRGKRVNATGVYLFFEPEYFQVQQLDTTMSFCQFYPEKKYDNNLGQVSVACGSPHPGISGEDTLMVIELIPIKLGDSTIRMGKTSQILASDGYGSNILNEYPWVPISILNTL